MLKHAILYGTAIPTLMKTTFPSLTDVTGFQSWSDDTVLRYDTEISLPSFRRIVVSSYFSPFKSTAYRQPYFAPSKIFEVTYGERNIE